MQITVHIKSSIAQFSTISVVSFALVRLRQTVVSDEAVPVRLGVGVVRPPVVAVVIREVSVVVSAAVVTTPGVVPRLVKL